nr:DUF4123 domain-containing protein [uncultured Caldimonas sp.]
MSTAVRSIGEQPRTRFDSLAHHLVLGATSESSYLLIDQRHTPAQWSLIRDIPLHAKVCLWEGSSMASNAALAPLLVRVAPEQAPAELLHRLLEDESCPHWSFVLLRSPLDLESLSRHFVAFKDYSVQGAEFEYVLHLADSRVVQRLPLAFEQHRWQSFLRPLSLIAYLDRLGSPHQIKGPAELQIFTLPAHQPVMQLEPSEHRALVDLAYPDKLTAQLRAGHGDALQEHDYASLYFLVENLLQEAKQFGLKDETDLQTYVKAGVFLTPRFSEHPAVAKLLSAAASPGSFASAFHQLPVGTLEEIGEGSA